MADIKLDERFLRCTVLEQNWLLEFAVDHDLIRATKAAFNVKTDEQARSYGLSVMGRDRVAGLLRDYILKRSENTLPTVDELRHLYMDLYHIPAATVREKLQALTAYERVSGFQRKSKEKDNSNGSTFSILDDLDSID